MFANEEASARVITCKDQGCQRNLQGSRSKSNRSLESVCRGRSDIKESLGSDPKPTRMSERVVTTRVDKLVKVVNNQGLQCQ
jgi:hypothetical protein